MDLRITTKRVADVFAVVNSEVLFEIIEVGVYKHEKAKIGLMRGLGQ